MPILQRRYPTTRWCTTLSSKVNPPHSIDFRVLCGTNLVTLPPEFRWKRIPRTPPCGPSSPVKMPVRQRLSALNGVRGCHTVCQLTGPMLLPTSPQSGIKSSFLVALMCTTTCWIPASARTNQGPEKRRFDFFLRVGVLGRWQKTKGVRFRTSFQNMIKCFTMTRHSKSE